MATPVMSLSDPVTGFAAVTPSDTANFPGKSCHGLYIGVGGNVAAVDEQDNAVTFVGVPTGSILPIRAKRVNATNTTATSIVRLW